MPSALDSCCIALRLHCYIMHASEVHGLTEGGRCESCSWHHVPTSMRTSHDSVRKISMNDLQNMNGFRKRVVIKMKYEQCQDLGSVPDSLCLPGKLVAGIKQECSMCSFHHSGVTTTPFSSMFQLASKPLPAKVELLLKPPPLFSACSQLISPFFRCCSPLFFKVML